MKFQLRTVAMATAVSQHVWPILAAMLDFSKMLFSTKMEPIFLKEVENICLLPHIGVSLRIEWKRRK